MICSLIVLVVSLTKSKFFAFASKPLITIITQQRSLNKINVKQTWGHEMS